MAEELLDLEVVAVRKLTQSVKEFVLRHPQGVRLPPFSAGAHLRLLLPLANGLAERCYSLLDPKENPHVSRIAVSRAEMSAGGSAHMFDEVGVASRLQALPPKNDFELAAHARHHLLIAGGIGITPILSMVNALQVRNASMQLHYATRSLQTMVYRDELTVALRNRASFYFDDGDPAKGMPLAALLAKPSEYTHVYVCGPRSMIEAVRALAADKAWPSDQIHFESFGASQGGRSESAQIHLAKSGGTLALGSDETVLELLLRSGHDLLYDCKRGECGVCALRVIDGEVDHRDYVLDDTQKTSEGLMCVCVSRPAANRLVLDI